MRNILFVVFVLGMMVTSSGQDGAVDDVVDLQSALEFQRSLENGELVPLYGSLTLGLDNDVENQVLLLAPGSLQQGENLTELLQPDFLASGQLNNFNQGDVFAFSVGSEVEPWMVQFELQQKFIESNPIALETILAQQGWNDDLDALSEYQRELDIFFPRDEPLTDNFAQQYSEQIESLGDGSLYHEPVLEAEILLRNFNISSDLNNEVWVQNLNRLKQASQLGNMEATVLVGDSYLQGRGTLLDVGRGIATLSFAANAGEPTAFTSLGEFYLNNPDLGRTEDAVELLRTGLGLGDANAAQGLSEYWSGVKEYQVAIDLASYALFNGGSSARSQERARLSDVCRNPPEFINCEPLKIAIVTNREMDQGGHVVSFTDQPTQNYDSVYTVAIANVPYVDIDEELDADGNGRASWNYIWPVVRQPDQHEQSTVAYETPGDQNLLSEVIQSELAENDGGKFLLYVHGFNNSLEDAVVAMARMKQRGQIEGFPIVYSWAAGSGLVVNKPGMLPFDGYTRDEQIASNSCPQFQQFLASLSSLVGAENINIVAHSHGTKLVHGALTGCEFQGASNVEFGGQFDNIVYAAPDIDLFQFQESYERLATRTRQVTVYVSDKDLGILTGESLERGGLPRIGGTPLPAFEIHGIDLIDSTDLTNPFREYGHTYVFIMDQVLADLRSVTTHISIENRCVDSVRDDPIFRLRTDRCEE